MQYFPLKLLLLATFSIPSFSNSINSPNAFTPSIKVNLQASFPSAPYLVELLEAAGDENPDIYYPILDRIAQGYFDADTTDEQLYKRFLNLLQEDGLMKDLETLESFKFALAIRNSAPRIQAHYHYYNSTQHEDCEAWIELNGAHYCDADFKNETPNHSIEDQTVLPFDRLLSSADSKIITTLYADISTSHFRQLHQTASQNAKSGKSIYRLRHKPSTIPSNPLPISGYGVELALKRTDYIVIDDRPKGDAEQNQQNKIASTATLDQEENIDDLKPLSSGDLQHLGIKAASFIANSETPLETLLKLTRDFPKYSTSLTSQEINQDFVNEHETNRQISLPSGSNILWVNGVQYDPRKMDIFSFLDRLRRERKFVNEFRNLGVTSAESIALLLHPAIVQTSSLVTPQRYDWRDDNEGGKSIIWFNDLSKDKRYKNWPSDVMAFLRRSYPAPLPLLRRDYFNAIVPVDFSKPKDVKLLVGTIQSLIKRTVPIRWGIIPMTFLPESIDQAKVVYYLQESYGLSAVIKYLDALLESKETFLKPNQDIYTSVVHERPIKNARTELSFNDMLQDENLKSKIESSTQYLERMGILKSEDTIAFVNGVPIKRDDDSWLQALSQQIQNDAKVIERLVFGAALNNDDYVPMVFLKDSEFRRNPLIIPDNDKEITLVNLATSLTDVEELEMLPNFKHNDDISIHEASLVIIIADFSTNHGLQLAINGIQARSEAKSIDLILCHNPKNEITDSQKHRRFLQLYHENKANVNQDAFIKSIEALISEKVEESKEDEKSNKDYVWPKMSLFIKNIKVESGQSAIILNGRKIGPISIDVDIKPEDFDKLIKYEDKRTNPASIALNDIKSKQELDSVINLAKLRSLLAISQSSDLPEGMFETAPVGRVNYFNLFEDKYTSFAIGDNSTAVIRIVASIDPASEDAQKWTPILNAISKLEGVFLKIFLNPNTQISELPVKRFYRYVIEHTPSFDEDGKVRGGVAEFAGIPSKALLTMAMDMPAAWLVTSKESIHDLDNIKLSTMGSNGDVEATYQLEYILIEGHSRDVTNEGAPSGVQLLLSDETQKVADTIIMSNLGYFQFKANPGHYSIALKPGPSQEIYNIDSVGSKGYSPQPGDESTVVTLLSFQGVTLYPRLSRKPGKEHEKVLEIENNPAADLIKQGADYVGSWLEKAGLKKETKHTKHADINIFSVASGHLYERMLNIMMVSVMKHTKHTVKFWFIEQFLSPSFKEFVPFLAKEYGFQYEMVTFKWPHWLRRQKEKQREIWGYKILFLDVLFPLDLDKVIFVDADQIVRTDMMNLINEDLNGAPYGFTPMCDSRTEIEGFRFWKQGYWKSYLRGLPYHISALYVVDLKRFRQLAAGDLLRQQYHQLSADPGSLSNLDQDLPNHLQMMIPIHSLDQNWLWCETWCSDESLKEARTIDLCNNPQTKEPKLDRARRQVPEWTVYDDEIADLAKKSQASAQIPLGQVQEADLFGDVKPKDDEKNNDKEDENILNDEASKEVTGKDKDEL